MRLKDLVQRLVLSFVVLDALEKILQHRLVAHVFVVRAVDLHLADGGLHDLRVVANRLDKQQLVAHLLDDDAVNHPAALARRVRRVEDLQAISNIADQFEILLEQKQ